MKSALHFLPLRLLRTVSALAVASMLAGCVGTRTEGERRARQDQESVGQVYRPSGERPTLPKLDTNAPLHDFLLFAMLNQSQVEAARLLTYRAAWLKDQGVVRTGRESSMAKLYSSEIAVRAAEECVQIHGGYGFIKDYPAEKFFRDVKLCTIGEGTSEIQRLVIARQLLGR